jgi:hypothetical protein
MLWLPLDASSCRIPDILLETVRVTENAEGYPYYIRLNSKSDLETFSRLRPGNVKATKDPHLFDCLSLGNCIQATELLIKNNIHNIDLGLFQVNYKSYKFQLHSYFDKVLAKRNACAVIEDKIAINNNRWDWGVLASYHSLTPKHNQNYSHKLQKNYQKLLKKGNQNENSNNR